MTADLCSLSHQIQRGSIDPADVLETALAAAQSPRCEHAFTSTSYSAARATASDPLVRCKPLAGLPVTVKDLFDCAGEVTRAGSIALSDAAPAQHDCEAVARLRRAGAAIIARTNMTEFAYSGVGINPHFGTPANAAWTDVPRIPGGSSSGAAISVATGAAFVALGSDTGGSIRIPAALNGLVGFKSTARLVPTHGAIPLSTTLDTVCAMTRSVSDSIVVHEILAQRRVTRSNAALSNYRLGIVRNLMQDDLEPQVAHAWAQALEHLRAGGADLREITLAPLEDLATLYVHGGFSGAESYAWHYPLLERHADLYDPRVAQRIRRGAALSAKDYIDLGRYRALWIQRMETAMEGFDALLSPTVPITAPPIADLAPGLERDDAFFRVNALLLRNPSVVNQLDGCAISIPCQDAGAAPVGLMVWAGALRDDVVLNVASQIARLLQK